MEGIDIESFKSYRGLQKNIRSRVENIDTQGPVKINFGESESLEENIAEAVKALYFGIFTPRHHRILGMMQTSVKSAIEAYHDLTYTQVTSDLSDSDSRPFDINSINQLTGIPYTAHVTLDSIVIRLDQ